MSQTQYVEYRASGFWAYDVALGILLKHMDVVDLRKPGSELNWLADALASWRVGSRCDYGLTIDAAWSSTQVDALVELVGASCSALGTRSSIPSAEVATWDIFPRGVAELATAPIVELGWAIVALVRQSLPEAPTGTRWLYGTPAGRTTLPSR